MSMFPKKAFDRETPDEQRLLEDLGWETLTDKERHQLLERLAAQASPRELPPKREQPSSSNSTRREPKSKKLKHEILSIDPVFLGEMVVTGYATTSVVGNVALSLHRHAQSSTGPRSSSKQGKSTKKNPFGRSGSSAAVKSPKGNTIVRLRDRKGRDIGKLEAATSTFIAKLLDWEWCTISGTLIYAATPLRIMDELLVSLQVTLSPRIFEGREEDRTSNEAKRALLLLFERVGLTATQGALSDELKKELLKDHSVIVLHQDGDEEKDMLSGDQVLDIYSRAQERELSFSGMDPKGPGMKLTLRDYQRVALEFMYNKETVVNPGSRTSLSTLWLEYKAQGDGTFFYFNPYTGMMSLEFQTEEHCAGGILADDMGLGKTIEILSLIHSNRFVDEVDVDAIDNDNEKLLSKATLIVCPLNLLSQWAEEIGRVFDKRTMSCQAYYDSDRSKMNASYFTNPRKCPDVIITTYGVLAHEFKQQGTSESPLFQVHWHRVVLDEAHYIKERTTGMAKAAHALQASNRWAVTGTPIVNKLEDLYSLVHFLRIQPWCQYSYWHAFITGPFEKKDSKAFEVVKSVMEPIILRRTKDMRDAKTGKLIVELPERVVDIVNLDFSTEEKEIYDALNLYSKKELKNLKLIGQMDYTHVFQLVLSMRLVCDHPLLIRKNASGAMAKTLELKDLIGQYCGTTQGFTSEKENQKNGNRKSKLTDYAKSVMEDLNDGEAQECPVCLDDIESNGVLLSCYHLVCQDCTEDILLKCQEKGKDGECPVCRESFTELDLLKIIRQKEKSASQEDKASDKSSTHAKRNQVVIQSVFKKSSKLRALVTGIQGMMRDAEDTKCVIFSQWTQMLDLVGAVLVENGWEYERLDGSLSQKTREKVLKNFKGTSSCRILIASLRSAGVGLNLTVASYVFLLDPWWNESVENQAIDRVHRLGQTRPVHIKRFIMQGSIEENMLDIQRRKSALAGAISSDSKVTLDDLVRLFEF